MNLDQLDAPEPFEPDDRFRGEVRRRGRALRHRRRRRIGAAVATPVVVAAAGLVWVDNRLDRVDSIEVAMPGSDAAEGGPVDILVVGTDAGLSDRQGEPNADALALARMDRSEGRIRVLALPRDLAVDDPDLGRVRLANLRGAAGPDGLVAGVEALLTVDGEGPGIDHYVELDTDALRELVDLGGGVPYSSPVALHDPGSGANVEVGCQVLDGTGLVALARSRRPLDPASGAELPGAQGDLHRIEVNVALARGLASGLLSSQPTPDALLALLGPVVEGLTVDSELSVATLADMGWWARSLPPQAVTTSVIPVETTPTAGEEGPVDLRPAAGWEDSVRHWRNGDETPVDGRVEPVGSPAGPAGSACP